MLEYELFVQNDEGTAWVCHERTRFKITKAMPHGKAVVIFEGEPDDLGIRLERLRAENERLGRRNGELHDSLSLLTLAIDNSDETADWDAIDPRWRERVRRLHCQSDKEKI